MTTAATTPARLKPCPFCGSHDIGIAVERGAGTGIFHRGEDIYGINCRDCGGSVPNMYNRDLIIERWNARASSSRAEVERIVSLALDHCYGRAHVSEDMIQWTTDAVLSAKTTNGDQS